MTACSLRSHLLQIQGLRARFARTCFRSRGRVLASLALASDPMTACSLRSHLLQIQGPRARFARICFRSRGCVLASLALASDLGATFSCAFGAAVKYEGVACRRRML